MDSVNGIGREHRRQLPGEDALQLDDRQRRLESQRKRFTS